MKEFIDINAEVRKVAKNDFERLLQAHEQQRLKKNHGEREEQVEHRDLKRVERRRREAFVKINIQTKFQRSVHLRRLAVGVGKRGESTVILDKLI